MTHLKMPSDSAKNAQATARRYYLVRAVYLAAIGVATLGWLWLIAWVALQLVYSQFQGAPAAIDSPRPGA